MLIRVFAQTPLLSVYHSSFILVCCQRGNRDYNNHHLALKTIPVTCKIPFVSLRGLFIQTNVLSTLQQRLKSRSLRIRSPDTNRSLSRIHLPTNRSPLIQPISHLHTSLYIRYRPIQYYRKVAKLFGLSAFLFDAALPSRRRPSQRKWNSSPCFLVGAQHFRGQLALQPAPTSQRERPCLPHAAAVTQAPRPALPGFRAV